MATVNFPKDVTSVSYGEKSFAVTDGVCTLPDDDPELVAGVRINADTLTNNEANLAAMVAQQQASSPTGQGQEFARAILREILLQPPAAPAAPAAETHSASHGG